jgi:hypothetical protein
VSGTLKFKTSTGIESSEFSPASAFRRMICHFSFEICRKTTILKGEILFTDSPSGYPGFC